MDRVILHCDMNSFFASVELLEHPELKDRPVAVCGDPESRHGIILAKNEPAKAFGIVTAETLSQARRKCPGLVLLRPHHEKYRRYSRLINSIYYRYTDMVEPFSIDESWLDVTASRRLFGTGREIADSIRETVKKELGLTLSAGVSYNKIFAKMGSEYRKPDATTEITRENYRDILWPQPVENMFFVGFATAQKLKSSHIHTIGDLACARDDRLESLLGLAVGVHHGAQRGGVVEGAARVRGQGEEVVRPAGRGLGEELLVVEPEGVGVAVVHLELVAVGVGHRVARPHGALAGRDEREVVQRGVAEDRSVVPRNDAHPHLRGVGSGLEGRIGRVLVGGVDDLGLREVVARRGEIAAGCVVVYR